MGSIREISEVITRINDFRATIAGVVEEFRYEVGQENPQATGSPTVGSERVALP